MGAPRWGFHPWKKDGEASILAQHERPFGEMKSSVSWGGGGLSETQTSPCQCTSAHTGTPLPILQDQSSCENSAQPRGLPAFPVGVCARDRKTEVG